MGSSQNCMVCLRTIKLTTFLMLLLVSSLTHENFMAEGRAVSKLLESVKKQRGEEEDDQEMMMMMKMRNEEIGSRPPKCERKCSSCTECEAVQVPVTAQPHQTHKRTHFASFRVAYSDSSQDDTSNYKPMSWKCKCGNLFFNP